MCYDLTMTKIEQLAQTATALGDDQLDGLIAYATYLAGEPLFYSAPEDVVASIERGLYAVNFGGGQVDTTSGKFVFSASEAYMVENGKILYPVVGATLIGNGIESLKQITMIGNDMQLDGGLGVCGKEGQSIPVGVGQPTLRIEGLTVGGTA